MFNIEQLWRSVLGLEADRSFRLCLLEFILCDEQVKVSITVKFLMSIVDKGWRSRLLTVLARSDAIAENF